MYFFGEEKVHISECCSRVCKGHIMSSGIEFGTGLFSKTVILGTSLKVIIFHSCLHIILNYAVFVNLISLVSRRMKI